MLIVAGTLYVAPDCRDTCVASLQDMIRRARSHPGCLDFTIAADPLEPDRINLFEHWKSEEYLVNWRSVANPPEPITDILRSDVEQHHIGVSESPFDN